MLPKDSLLQDDSCERAREIARFCRISQYQVISSKKRLKSARGFCEAAPNLLHIFYNLLLFQIGRSQAHRSLSILAGKEQAVFGDDFDALNRGHAVVVIKARPRLWGHVDRAVFFGAG